MSDGPYATSGTHSERRLVGLFSRPGGTVTGSMQDLTFSHLP